MKSKHLKTVLLCVPFSLFFFSVQAETNADSLYITTMKSAVEQMDTLTQKDDIQLCRMVFERVHRLYPDDWLSLYYVIYADLTSFYMDPKSANSGRLLEESKKNLALLKEYENGDMSEIVTLEGYYYMALIVSDPANNGRIYFTNTISAFEKAMELDADNPRPVCLLAFFEQKLPEMLHSKRIAKVQHDKAKELFSREAKDPILPHWGERYLSYII
ncbi:MAG TPA: hypothetical protein DEG28_01285 [Porphyromonadaceae bacterium]|nr:hypothetical protein [Porphyromonadaceae bacterium]